MGLDALMGIKTVAQIARENNVHPMQVSQWKTIVRERLPDLFDSDRKEAQNQEELIAALHQKIGQLTIDLDWLKKIQTVGSLKCREIIVPDSQVSLRRQCELMGLARSTFYYEPCPETPENLRLMRRLDELHLDHPVYGSRKLEVKLRQEGWVVNHKRVTRLLQVMGIQAIYPKPNLSQPGADHVRYPYLLADVDINGPDQVWCADITYVPMANGFMYLVAVMDWWSRYVLAWKLSNTLEAQFCVEAWEEALRTGRGTPLISNTDQGAQFTAPVYIDAVESAGVEVSMDGRNRWIDNRFIERLWRSAKYEDIYLQDYSDGLEAGRGLGRWFPHYNQERPHQALGYATPHEVYFNPQGYGGKPKTWEAMRSGPKDGSGKGRLPSPDPEGDRDTVWKKA